MKLLKKPKTGVWIYLFLLFGLYAGALIPRFITYTLYGTIVVSAVGLCFIGLRLGHFYIGHVNLANYSNVSLRSKQYFKIIIFQLIAVIVTFSCFCVFGYFAELNPRVLSLGEGVYGERLIASMNILWLATTLRAKQR